MRLPVLLAAVTLLFPATISWSATFSVRPDGTGDHATIQDAVNAAADGDSIVLAPGRFTGPGNRDIDTLGKAVVITSRHGPDATEIDAEYQARVFHIHQGETNTTVISNIRISRGFTSDAVGAGMRCDGGSPLLADLAFGPNAGLGLAIANGNVDVIRCRFVDDPPAPAGLASLSAVFIDHAGARLVDCYFSGYSSGVLHGTNASVVMVGNLVENIRDGAAQGLVLFENSTVSVLGNIVRFNLRFNDSGLLFWQCTGEVWGNWIEGNRANLARGGVTWEESVGDVSFNLLRENDGPGIQFSRSGGSIRRNLIVRTQGGGPLLPSGTAIEVYGCDPVVVENNTLYRNGDEYDEYLPDYSAAEIVLHAPSAQVGRNVIVGKSDYPWMICDMNAVGCTAALLADTVFVDDTSNLVFGEGQGLNAALSTPCFDYPQHLDPLFRSEANDNFFLRPESPAVIDTIIGNYHIRRSWGALPKGSRPTNVLDVQAPFDHAPSGVQPGDRYPLAGFSITNTSTMDAVVNYRLFASGGGLHDNGDPLSLVGTTPILVPGESFVPPPAAVVVPDGDATIEVKYAFAYAPALDIVDTVTTTIHFGAPVSVRVTSFEARAELAGVRLRWSTAAGTSEAGWLVDRADADREYRRLTPSPLSSHTRIFLDAFVSAGVRYRYRLVALDPDETIAAEIEITPTARLALEQNVPNPFNPETTIQFSLPAAAHALVIVYGVDGSHIRTLVDRVLPGGVHREMWDGRDARGIPLSSGIYFCKLTAQGRTLTRKMVLAK